MRKILVAERIDEEGIKILKNNFDVDVKFELERDELLGIIDRYDGLVVRSITKVNKELLDKAVNLKMVGRAGNGTDNIDINYATKKGVIVANTPESNTMSACELTIGLLLAQCRNIPQANYDIKKGNWRRNIFQGVELYNKTLGIIGLGRIGSLVAARMKAFGMNVIAYDPYISDIKFERLEVEKKENLDDLLKEADFITVHTPKTKETLKMISHDQIKLMKDGVRITNAARGGIIDEEALLKGLKSGRVKSAGLDVHEVEPCQNNPFFHMENVIMTPHMGASTLEAQENVGKTIANQVVKGLKGDIVPNAVNLPTIHRDELKVLKPYIELAENLGKIYYQLYNDHIEYVDVKYFGNMASQDNKMVTIALLKGMLEPIVKEKVNYINSFHIAKEMGIVIKEQNLKENYKNYFELISITVKGKENTLTVSGNLSGKREGKIVELNGYEVEVSPTNHMLFIQNHDVPGVVGHIGTILGEEKVNIATMQVGRNIKGEKALMVLNVDNPVCKTTIDKLEDRDDLIWAKPINL